MFGIRKTAPQKGSIIISLVITMPFLILITVSYLNYSLNNYRVARKDQFHTYAQLAADAGIDYAMQQISADNTWSGTGGPITLQNDSSAKTTFETTLATVDSTTKTLTTIGRTFFPATSSAASSTVKIVTTLRAVNSGNYSIVTGVGGLTMSNSSKILGGDVFINGELSMSNTAQVGLSTSPVNLYVAQQNCPSPATAAYPRLCTSGEKGQPITINNSAKIYGNVRANNQTSGSGMSNPGLTASSGVVPAALPTHDRDAQKTAIANTVTGSSVSCSGNGSNDNKVIEANTKVTGDLTLRNSCTVTIKGNVWITGKLDTANTTKLILDNSAGTNTAIIMVDGISGVALSNTTTVQQNSSNTGFQFITYWSAASCSPDCSNVTGTDLYNSRGTTTINLNNSGNAANSIFYARWSKVDVGNTGSIGAIVGQEINLHNSGTITFSTSIGTGTSYWVIDGYKRTF